MPRWVELLRRFVIGLEAPTQLRTIKSSSELSQLLPHTYPIMQWRGRSVEGRELTLYSSDESSSFLRLFYPLSSFTNEQRSKYDFSTSFGMIHWLEDMDTFVADVASLHCQEVKRGDRTLVTGLLETLVWLGGDKVDGRDACLSGQVTWVGKSSMQVTVELTLASLNDDQEESDPPPPIALATFLMMSRSLDLTQSVAVDMIEVKTENQRRRFETGSQLALARRDHRKASDPLSIGDSTLIETSLMTEKGDRNTSGTTFGGHLIKLAFEHAVRVAEKHAEGKSVRLRAIEEGLFIALVPINATLEMRGQVIKELQGGDSNSSEIEIKVQGYVGETRSLDFTFFFDIL